MRIIARADTPAAVAIAAMVSSSRYERLPSIPYFNLNRDIHSYRWLLCRATTFCSAIWIDHFRFLRRRFFCDFDFWEPPLPLFVTALGSDCKAVDATSFLILGSNLRSPSPHRLETIK